MSARVFSNEQKLKLTQIINEGIGVLQEIEDLQGSLKDTVKSVAEELQLKPAIINKAIKLAHKSEFGREQQDHELLEQILVQVGKTL